MRSSQSQELTSSDIGEFIERPALTDKQVEFFHVYLSSPFLSLKQICEQAQVQQRTVKGWIATSDEFRKALMTEQNRSRAVSNMSRKRVMRGMLEAVDMARELKQANTMLSGYKEIGRMCGFYEPERREVTLSVQAKEIVKEMKTLSREQLLDIAEQQDIEDPVPEVFDNDGVIENE